MDRIQQTEKGNAGRRLSRRELFRVGGAATLALAGNSVDLSGVDMVVKTVASGLSVALDKRAQGIAAAQCGSSSTDGRAPLCSISDENLWAQSYFGGHYFNDVDGDGKFNPAAGDTAEQGVKDRQLLVEVIRAKRWGDHVQLNPESRKVNGTEVSYQDVKDGNNSGERFVERWTVFKIPSDGGVGLGIDLRTGRDRLVLELPVGSEVDKSWGPVDDDKRYERHECSGACGWNCLQVIQVSRLKAGAKFDLSGVVSNELILRDRDTNLLSSFTDELWYWDSKEKSDAHVDYNRSNTPLTDALRRSEGVVKSTVLIPGPTVRYDNHSK